jgi:hypothetical protein
MADLTALLEELAGPQAGLDPERVKTTAQARRHRKRRRMRLGIALVTVFALAAVVIVSTNGGTPPRIDVAQDLPDWLTPRSWSALPSGPVDGRTFPSVLWTGDELIVWGGEIGSDATRSNDGAAFDPTTGRWRRLPRAPIPPRSQHAAVWTGNEMIVCCGGVVGTSADKIAAYSPRTNSWRTLESQSELETITAPGAVWTGERMVVTGGRAAGSIDAALQYDPTTDTWQGIRELSPVTIDASPAVFWTGHEVLVVPRSSSTDNPFIGDGPVAFDPTAGTWRALPAPPAELAIARPSATWTGHELLAWGVSRQDPSHPLQRREVGARLDIETGIWRPMSPAPIGPIDYWDGTSGSNSAIWDAPNERMIVFTGAIGTGTDPSAPTPILAYTPGTDTWEPLPSYPAQSYNPTLLIADNLLLIVPNAKPISALPLDHRPPTTDHTDETVTPSQAEADAEAFLEQMPKRIPVSDETGEIVGYINKDEFYPEEPFAGLPPEEYFKKTFEVTTKDGTLVGYVSREWGGFLSLKTMNEPGFNLDAFKAERATGGERSS